MKLIIKATQFITGSIYTNLKTKYLESQYEQIRTHNQQ